MSFFIKKIAGLPRSTWQPGYQKDPWFSVLILW